MSGINKTKGQLEAEISNALTQFEREHPGRGPKEAKTFVIQDMLLIRLKGVLTPAEESLAREEDGATLIKQVRMRLIESSRRKNICKNCVFAYRYQRKDRRTCVRFLS